MPTISTTLTLANSACFISRYKFKGVGGTAIGSSQPCGTSATHAYTPGRGVDQMRYLHNHPHSRAIVATRRNN